MGVNGQIIVLDDPQARRSDRKKLLSSALQLSRWFHAPVRIMTVTLESAVIAESEKLERGLLVVGLKHGERGGLGGWRAKLLERCRRPILILPPEHELRGEGFGSFFVPMSGEMRSNAALDWAIRRGNELKVPVDIFHVTEAIEKCGCDPSIVGHVSDEFHHEYPRLVEEFINEASPFTSGKEKLVIREFFHCSGDPLKLLSAQIRKRRQDLLVLEWKGHLESGRARLVKYFIGRGDIPVLLVRQIERVRFRLKVGEDFEAA